MAEENQQTPPAQNDEVEETTASEAPTEETDEQTPEAEGQEETQEETPSEETEESADEGGQESPEPETEETEGEKPPKGGRAQKRIRELVRENKRLQQESQTQQQPVGQPQQVPPHMQQQAQQALASVNQTIQQTGQLPTEISRAEYQALVQMANGQVMAQQHIAEAQQETQNIGLERKVQALERTLELDADIRDRTEKYPELREGSDSYDPVFEDLVSDVLTSEFNENQNMNVGSAIDRLVKVYRAANKQRGEKVSATLAKQAAGSALPSSTSKRSDKTDQDKSLNELEAEIGTTGRGPIN